MLELTESTFDAAVSKAPLILVDFWAPWCGPCRALGPTLQKISDRGYSVAKVNVQDEQALAVKYNIGAIPTLLVFKNGQVVKTSVGGMKEETLVEMMESAK